MKELHKFFTSLDMHMKKCCKVTVRGSTIILSAYSFAAAILDACISLKANGTRYEP